MARELKAEELYRRCDPDQFDFETTAEMEELPEILGQPRATAAIELSVGIEKSGYNVFAYGRPGTGRHTAVRKLLDERAKAAEAPPDICYVNNFEQAHQPRLLLLPPGRGCELKKDMDRLVEELSTTLEAALESDEYQTRRQVIEGKLEERQSEAISELGEEAQGKGLALVRTPVGIVFAPVRKEEVLSPEEFQSLPDKERERLKEEIEHFKEQLQKVVRQFPRWQRETRERIRELNREVSRFAVEPLIGEVKEKFSEIESVIEFLDQVQADVVENVQSLVSQGDDQVQQAIQSITGGQALERPVMRRYRVNVLVDHAETEGAPLIYEDNPTYQNLVGRVEHIPQMGAVVTDFNLIKPGALHKANGGYLLVDALRLLQHPYAWEGLKRALLSGEIKIESLGEALSLISTYSLEPEPVQLKVKIIVFGTSLLYYLLSAYDPDFDRLFKVEADFAEEMDWETDGESQSLYARRLGSMAHGENLRPFDRTAMARLVEESARQMGDSQKVSLHFRTVLDLLREADYWAGKAGEDRVTAEHVQRAVDAQIFRADRLRERVQEQIRRGTLLIDTEGGKVGQVNGLSVLQLGSFSFGRPSRITARIRLGKGEVVDIEREVDLSGPIHSKGVLILGGFLGSRYARKVPLALSASLVFEQSYGGIDGDSASSAELYALLSEIAQIPIDQSYAVTGSVNQAGEVQAIGGVNHKIEGFFDVCSQRGLTGRQGVLIPVSNVKHLMLRRDVVEAVEAGRFHVYPVTTIDEGLQILTGQPAGEPDAEGVYPEETVNGQVARRLEELAETARLHSQRRAPGPAAGEAEE